LKRFSNRVESIMFWRSVLGGAEVLLHWATYAALIEYLLLFMTPTALIAAFSERQRDQYAMTTTMLFILPAIFQVAATVVFTLTMSPIIFGTNSAAAWLFPLQLLAHDPVLLAKHVGICALAMGLVAMIPYVGRVHSLHVLAVGGYTLVFVLSLVEPSHTAISAGSLQIFPGVWTLAGMLAAAGIISAAVGYIVGPILVSPFILLHMRGDIVRVVAMVAGAAVSFLPLFIYGAWLGQNLTSAMGLAGH
jgi:hypothetical protein